MKNFSSMIICLMGPTAVGKTPFAVEMVKQFLCEIVSVDSAMVYRGMDIGTAKPTADVLRIAPHHLINIADPADIYSVGQFRVDALRVIADIHARGKIPLLVGGTMMYFRALQQGLAPLPHADRAWRMAFAERVAQAGGWEAMHAQLAQIDPDAATRIHVHDSQRIQRAFEVFELTGKTISAWQTENTAPLSQYRVYNVALVPSDRTELHARIAARFQQMLADGFMEEMEKLYARGDLSPDLPSMRSVGYREGWAHLAGEINFATMCEKTVIATRQLAKRQLTWLRSWPEVQMVTLEMNKNDKKNEKETTEEVKTLVTFLRQSPLVGLNLDFSRDKSLNRDIDL